MQLLDAAGVPCEGCYPAYEVYPVGGIPWESIRGRAVKVVDMDKQLPPDGYLADYVYLHRDRVQQAYSLLKFLRYFGTDAMVPVFDLCQNFDESYSIIDKWLAKRRGGRLVHLNFEDLIDTPLEACKRLLSELGLPDEKLDALPRMILPRKSSCHPEVLEEYLVQRGKAGL